MTQPQESPHKGKTGLKRVWNAFFYSLEGFQAAWKHEDAFRQETLLALILIPLAFLLTDAPLEQAQQTNSLLTGLQTQTAGLFQAQTAGLVGKTVKVDGSGFSLKAGAASMNLELGAAANVTLTVKDANGKVVATLPQGHLNRGLSTVAWDGKDADGNVLPDGPYKVEVTATGDDGKPALFRTSLSMKVDAVTFSNGGIYLASGGNVFALSDVLEITA